MIHYFIRRLILIPVMLIGITFLSFGIMQLAPGDATDMLTSMNVKVSPDAKARIVNLYGLDKPWYERYGYWLSYMVRLDFGRSAKDDKPVMKKIMERLPATLLLQISALFFIFLFALPIGIISAVKQDSVFDKSMTVFVFIGYSVPTFGLALLLMILFGLKLGWLPISGLRSFYYEDLTFFGRIWDIAKHLVLPVFISAFTGLAGISRYMRNGMLEVIRQDYIRTARAKGLTENVVIYKHALRNALLPIVTILGLTLPSLIGGSFIFETIFAYPGMGRLGYDAIMARDTNVIMGVGVIVALLTLAGNFLADMAYGCVDPRIRYSK